MPETDGFLRLDLLIHPFAPAPSARALAARDESWTFSPRIQQEMLLSRLSRIHQVAPEAIVVFPGDVDLDRLGVDTGTAAHLLTGDGMVTVASPDRDTGHLLTVHQAVRLARSSDAVLIDERVGGYSHRDHLPLYREFDNVLLLRTLDPWLLPLGHQLTYLIGKPALLDTLGIWQRELDPRALGLAVATLEDGRYLTAANRQVMKERVALIRSLRKLNMVRPLSSAAGFVSASVERGDREALRLFLERERIRLHYPRSSERDHLIRISAVSAGATARLRDALISWAREI